MSSLLPTHCQDRKMNQEEEDNSKQLLIINIASPLSTIPNIALTKNKLPTQRLKNNKLTLKIRLSTYNINIIYFNIGENNSLHKTKKQTLIFIGNSIHIKSRQCRITIVHSLIKHIHIAKPKTRPLKPSFTWHEKNMLKHRYTMIENTINSTTLPPLLSLHTFFRTTPYFRHINNSGGVTA